MQERKRAGDLVRTGIEALGAPAPLGGIVIAMLVLSPEGVAAVQAAARNQMQRGRATCCSDRRWRPSA